MCRISVVAVLDLRPWRGCRRDCSLGSKDHAACLNGDATLPTHLTTQAQPKRHAALSPPPCAPVASRHLNAVLPVALCVSPPFLTDVFLLSVCIHTAPGLPRGQPDVFAVPATRVYDGTPCRGSRSTAVRGGLHLACSCMAQAYPTGDIPAGMGRLVVCSSPYHVPEITRTLRSLYANEDHATVGHPHESLWL